MSDPIPPPPKPGPSWGCIILIALTGIALLIFGVCVVAFLSSP